jgi:hypothetical protein
MTAYLISLSLVELIAIAVWEDFCEREDRSVQFCTSAGTSPFRIAGTIGG